MDYIIAEEIDSSERPIVNPTDYIQAKQNPSTFLQESAPAAKSMFTSIKNYKKILKGRVPIKWTPYRDSAGNLILSASNTNKEQKRNLDLIIKYNSYNFSENILYGSIIQIAYNYISLFSTNTIIPDYIQNIIPTNILKSHKKAVLFCIGRPIHNIPLGLIIYAARNLYNHWNEGNIMDKINVKVFEILTQAHIHNPFADLTYTLSNPTICMYSKSIVEHLLKWDNYKIYHADLKRLQKEFVKYI